MLILTRFIFSAFRLTNWLKKSSQIFKGSSNNRIFKFELGENSHRHSQVKFRGELNRDGLEAHSLCLNLKIGLHSLHRL